jgi:hypothetical protein
MNGVGWKIHPIAQHAEKRCAKVALVHLVGCVVIHLDIRNIIAKITKNQSVQNVVTSYANIVGHNPHFVINVTLDPFTIGVEAMWVVIYVYTLMYVLTD